jgi:hypothetical protein
VAATPVAYCECACGVCELCVDAHVDWLLTKVCVCICVWIRVYVCGSNAHGWMCARVCGYVYGIE